MNLLNRDLLNFTDKTSYLLRRTTETFSCSYETCIPVFVYSSNNFFSNTLMFLKQSATELIIWLQLGRM